MSYSWESDWNWGEFLKRWRREEVNTFDRCFRVSCVNKTFKVNTIATAVAKHFRTKGCMPKLPNNFVLLAVFSFEEEEKLKQQKLDQLNKYP